MISGSFNELRKLFKKFFATLLFQDKCCNSTEFWFTSLSINLMASSKIPWLQLNNRNMIDFFAGRKKGESLTKRLNLWLVDIISFGIIWLERVWLGKIKDNNCITYITCFISFLFGDCKICIDNSLSKSILFLTFFNYHIMA